MTKNSIYQSFSNIDKNQNCKTYTGNRSQPTSVKLPNSKKLLRSSNYNDCELMVDKKCVFHSVVFFNIILMLWGAISYRSLPEYKIYNQDTFKFSKGSVKIKSCNIPNLEPFADEISHLLKTADEIDCAAISAATSSRSGDISFHTERGSTLLIRDRDYGRECCYRPFRRISDTQVDVESPCYELVGNVMEIPPQHEFIEVFCVSKGPDFSDGFALVPLKPSVEQRISNYEKTAKKGKENRMSVIILGLDATSHMNVKRKLPESLKYLTEEMSIISMDQYTKVAENTLPNVIPLLTGMQLNKFKEKCVDSSGSSQSVHLDICPFIWKTFASQGYRTSFAEDDVNIGIFNMDWPYAFSDPPTDYYFRPFSYQMQKGGTQHEGKGEYCYGSRLSFQVLLENIENMATTFRNEPFFQFTWATKLTHDDYNKLALGDSHLLSSLKYLNENSVLNNTVLILMSDHGSRLGDIRKTQQGQLEDRLPFVFFALPKWFSGKYPQAVENLKNNTEHLTSAFDVHQTLKDFMNLERIEDKNLAPEDLHQNVMQKKLGTSLFRKLSEKRTCSSVGIPAHWCLCHSKSEVSTSADIAKEAVNFVLNSVNSLLKQYRYSHQCAQLTLDTITAAWQWNSKELEYENFDRNPLEDPTQDDNENRQKEIIILQVSFTTSPGAGEFEATVLKHPEKNWILTEQVVRTNSYEGQSNCAQQHMKEYCYCKKSLF